MDEKKSFSFDWTCASKNQGIWTPPKNVWSIFHNLMNLLICRIFRSSVKVCSGKPSLFGLFYKWPSLILKFSRMSIMIIKRFALLCNQGVFKIKDQKNNKDNKKNDIKMFNNLNK